MTIEIPHTIATQIGLRQADGAVETSGGRVVAPPVTLPPEGPSGFDYSILNRDLADEAREAAGRIKISFRASTLEIGHDLIAIKVKMPHGTFGRWVAAEFGFSDRTAENYMSAVRFLEGKSETVSLLPPAALYALSAPTASPDVVKEVLEQVDAGVSVTTTMIRDKLAGAKAIAQKQAGTARLKKQRENEKQRRAEMEARDLKWKEDIKAKAERVQNAAKFLVSKLGSSGVLELFRLLGDAEIYSLGSAFHGGDWSAGSPRLLTEQEIEERFGGRSVS